MQCITSAEEKHLAEQTEGESNASIDAEVDNGHDGEGTGTVRKTTTISVSAA